MGKKNGVRPFANNMAEDTNEKNVLAAIEQARRELQECRDLFDSVNEPILIDYAIYKEAAAKSKYAYLLAEARKLKLKADQCDFFANEEVE